MNIYGGFISSNGAKSSGIEIYAIVITAENMDEARGKALRFAKEQFPPDSGYCNHKGGVAEVPTEIITKVLTNGAK